MSVEILEQIVIIVDLTHFLLSLCKEGTFTLYLKKSVRSSLQLPKVGYLAIKVSKETETAKSDGHYPSKREFFVL